jgi:ribosomal protein L11 methyltransferase
MESVYCHIVVRNLERKSEEDFTLFCFENGAQGVSETLAFSQPELKYEPTLVETATFAADLYFDKEPGEDFFLKLQAEFPRVTVERYIEKNRDWLEEWKKGFEPFLFAEPFWIVPSWREKPSEAKEFVWMEPGMAFGTGTHETTQLAAQLLIKHWPKMAQAVGGAEKLSVIDVGTGTGILAILAEKQGAKKIVAIDIDLECRRVARENSVQNQTSVVEVPDLNIEEIQDQFDLVIANIIDGILLDIKPDLLRVLKPGGHLILSGLLTKREEAFCESFLSGTQLQIKERISAGEWAALILVQS